jgi:hypothetical protein
LSEPIAVTQPASRTAAQQDSLAELEKLGDPNILVVPELEYDFVVMLAQAGKQANSIDPGLSRARSSTLRSPRSRRLSVYLRPSPQQTTLPRRAGMLGPPSRPEIIR